MRVVLHNTSPSRRCWFRRKHLVSHTPGNSTAQEQTHFTLFFRSEGISRTLPPALCREPHASLLSKTLLSVGRAAMILSVPSVGASSAGLRPKDGPFPLSWSPAFDRLLMRFCPLGFPCTGRSIRRSLSFVGNSGVGPVRWDKNTSRSEPKTSRVASFCMSATKEDGGSILRGHVQGLSSDQYEGQLDHPSYRQLAGICTQEHCSVSPKNKSSQSSIKNQVELSRSRSAWMISARSKAHR